MQNRLIILLITLTVSLSCRAMTCPPVDQIDLNNPPPGWEVLKSPKHEAITQQFHFTKAWRSLDFYYSGADDFPIFIPYYGQVICSYNTNDTNRSTFFELVSDYYSGAPLPSPPWEKPSWFSNLWECKPPNHDPAVCVFEAEDAEQS